MTPNEFVARLLATTDEDEQDRLLQDHISLFDDEVAKLLKDKAVQLRMSNTTQALQIVAFILKAAQITERLCHRAYGLWAEAIIRSLSLGEYERALASYDEAIAIFEAKGDVLNPAIMQLSRLWSLANLNRHTEALVVGEQAGSILKMHEKWLFLATLQLNLGNVYTRVGNYAKALTMFKDAQRSYEALGKMDEEIEGLWALAEHDCSISLCYLGRFEEAIQASQRALALQERLGNRIEATRVRQHLAVTYFMLGRYNQALQLLEQARETFLADNLMRHAARVDLYICDCLLSLRRFDRVLEKSLHIRALFQKIKALHEEGLAILYQAIAYAGIQKNSEALATLREARYLFETEKSAVWYLNGLYRSLKAWRRGNKLGARLEAAQTADYLVTTLFALEHRWRPYSSRLIFHLDKLSGQGWQSGELQASLLDLISTGEPGRQQALARRVTALLRERGFGHVYDAWEGQIDQALDRVFH